MTDDCSPAQHRVSYSARLASAELQHGGQLGQFRLMLVRVVLAEEKLSSGRQLGAYASCSTAAVAAVCSGQLGNGQSCIHGFSVLVYPLSQTYGVFALFPDRYQVCRFSRVSDDFPGGSLR